MKTQVSKRSFGSATHLYNGAEFFEKLRVLQLVFLTLVKLRTVGCIKVANAEGVVWRFVRHGRKVCADVPT